MTSSETAKGHNPEADLVVVGGGGAGLAAAVAAAEEGAKNIIVLEARNIPGGKNRSCAPNDATGRSHIISVRFAAISVVRWSMPACPDSTCIDHSA